MLLFKHVTFKHPTKRIAYSHVLAYMRGVQQRRVGKVAGSKVNDTTYGIVSDGISWDCFKPKGDKLYFYFTYDLKWERGNDMVWFGAFLGLEDDGCCSFV